MTALDEAARAAATDLCTNLHGSVIDDEQHDGYTSCIKRHIAPLLEAKDREIAELRKIADENYMELVDEMNERWGYSHSVRFSVDWPEIHAFMESRFVHKPARSLRQEIAELRASRRELSGRVRWAARYADRILSESEGGENKT